jgi:hypothetical protein
MLVIFLFVCPGTYTLVKLFEIPVVQIQIRGLFDPWIRDPGWVESQHPDPGSGMNNPDHIF